MIDATPLDLAAIVEVRDNCLCLASARAARRLARRFDRAFQPIGLTNGQFSALMFLAGRPLQSPGALADLLAMDRTSVTAMLKALERRGLVEIRLDDKDGRRRLLSTTQAGRRLLSEALPIWRREHSALSSSLPPEFVQTGRALMAELSHTPLPDR